MYLRKYETVTLVDPEVGHDGLAKIVDRIREGIKKTGGREVRLEDWGRRRLAYRLGKHSKAHYLYMLYLGTNESVAEIERVLGITEQAIKYQTVLLDPKVDDSAFDADEAKQVHTSHARPSALEGTTLGPPPLEGYDEDVEDEDVVMDIGPDDDDDADDDDADDETN